MNHDIKNAISRDAKLQNFVKEYFSVFHPSLSVSIDRFDRISETPKDVINIGLTTKPEDAGVLPNRVVAVFPGSYDAITSSAETFTDVLHKAAKALNATPAPIPTVK